MAHGTTEKMVFIEIPSVKNKHNKIRLTEYISHLNKKCECAHANILLFLHTCKENKNSLIGFPLTLGTHSMYKCGICVLT